MPAFSTSAINPARPLSVRNLRVKAVVVIDGANIFNQFKPIKVDIIQTTDERADECGTKHKVTFTMVPSSDSALQVCKPAHVSGTFTAILSAILASLRPSASMVFDLVDLGRVYEKFHVGSLLGMGWRLLPQRLPQKGQSGKTESSAHF